eukprot:TRINITY_DN1099_c0_g2_i1.p1 TRINITY_DN1099_c0_g2~~TRINITY_DN1099_c0_g2_i1.p1  ORF type:complete len:707 (+),score=164.24 TRINITY_DN1099_c0_g2_i1:303-2123(+)
MRTACSDMQDRHVSEIRDLQIKLEAATKNTSSDTSSSEQVQQLQEQNKKLSSKLESKNEELESIRTACSEMQDRHVNDIRSMQIKLESKDSSSQNGSNPSQEEITQLTNKLKSKSAELEEMRTACSDMQDRHVNEIRRLQIEADEKLSKQRVCFEKSEAEKKELAAQLGSYQSQDKETTVLDITELTLECEKKTAEIKNLRQANAQLAAEIANLRSQFKSHQDQTPTNSSDVTKLRAEITTLASEVSALYKQVEDLTSIGVLHHYEKEALLKELETITESNTLLTNETRKLSGQLDERNGTSETVVSEKQLESCGVQTDANWASVEEDTSGIELVPSPKSSPPKSSPPPQLEPEEVRVSKEIDRKVREERERIARDRLRAEASVERAIREHQQSKAAYSTVIKNNGHSNTTSAIRTSVSPVRSSPSEYSVKYRPVPVSPARMRPSLRTTAVGPPLTAEAHAFRREVAEVKKAVSNTQSPVRGRLSWQGSPGRSPPHKYYGSPSNRTSPLKSVLSSPRSPSTSRISRLSTRRQDWEQRHGEFEDNVSLLKAQLEGLSDAMKRSTLAAHELSDKWKTVDIDSHSVSPGHSWRSSPIPAGRRSVSPTHY